MSKFLHAALFANPGKVEVSEFQVEKIRDVRDKIPPESLSSARTFTVIATGHETFL